MRLECSKDHIGAVHHPESGDLVQLNEEHPESLARTVAAAHDHVSLADDESESTASDSEPDVSATDENTATQTELCGVEMTDGSVCERPVDECPYH